MGMAARLFVALKTIGPAKVSHPAVMQSVVMHILLAMKPAMMGTPIPETAAQSSAKLKVAGPAKALFRAAIPFAVMAIDLLTRLVMMET